MTDTSAYPARQLGQIDLQKAIILDVRTAMEHGEKRLGLGHIHVPLDQLNVEAFTREHGLNKETPIYILCRSGARAAKAAQQFQEQGYKNTRVIEGGIVACEECGQKIEGRMAKACCNIGGPISLERQVRIAAGSFVVLGVLLSLFVHPLFITVPLFVGCGLIFAGVTDRCGMALVLTKAPWNKVAQKTT